MTESDIARRAREIREAEERAMFGRPAGADDDLDGDRPKCAECMGLGAVPSRLGWMNCQVCGGDGRA